MSRDMALAQGKSADRPDGAAERLVRIETRLVKYQQANALALEEVGTALTKLTKAVERNSSLVRSVLEHE